MALGVLQFVRMAYQSSSQEASSELNVYLAAQEIVRITDVNERSEHTRELLAALQLGDGEQFLAERASSSRSVESIVGEYAKVEEWRGTVRKLVNAIRGVQNIPPYSAS
jgi:hypothetical protein